MKVLYIDVETSGLWPKFHDIIEMSYILEVDDEVVYEGTQRLAPDPDRVDPKALEVNGISLEEALRGAPQSVAFNDFLGVLNRYINKYDRKDKAYIAGHNVIFDRDFLIEFFKKNNCPYFGSYFMYKIIDPLWLCHWLEYLGYLKLPNYKLGTLCEHFGIELKEAHTAKADIVATRQLIEAMKRRISWDERSSPPDQD